MLVLNRKAGEEIRIGDDIRVVVTEISGRQVRLGVEAPRGVKILRGELHDFGGPLPTGGPEPPPEAAPAPLPATVCECLEPAPDAGTLFCRTCKRNMAARPNEGRNETGKGEP